MIASAMSAHSHSSGLQVKACRALRNFADNSAENQVTRLLAANSACRVSGVALRLRRVLVLAISPVFAHGCAPVCWRRPGCRLMQTASVCLPFRFVNVHGMLTTGRHRVCTRVRANRSRLRHTAASSSSSRPWLCTRDIVRCRNRNAACAVCLCTTVHPDLLSCCGISAWATRRAAQPSARPDACIAGPLGVLVIVAIALEHHSADTCELRSHTLVDPCRPCAAVCLFPFAFFPWWREQRPVVAE